MGNKNSSIAINPSQNITGMIQQFLQSSNQPTFQQIMSPIKYFLSVLGSHLPYHFQSLKEGQETVKKIVADENMVRIFHHPNYHDKILGLFNLLMKKLRYMIKKKAMILITQEQWEYTSLLADFLIIFMDDRIRTLCDSLKSRNDITSQTKKLATSQTINPILISEVDGAEIEDYCEILQKVLYHSLNMKNSVIPRSGLTQTYVNSLIKSLSLFYMKLYFNCRPETKLKFSTINLTQNITIIGYCIGLGLSQKSEVVIDICNLQLEHMIKQSPSGSKVKAFPLPSHIYDKIPNFHCENMFQSILIMNLYALTHLEKKKVSEKKEVYTYYYKINRIQSLKIIKFVLNRYEGLVNPEVMYYFDLLWSKIQITKLQRHYIHQIALKIRRQHGVTPLLNQYFKKIKDNEVSIDQKTDQNLIYSNQNVTQEQLMEETDQIITQIQSVIDNPLPLVEALSQKYIFEKICKVPTKTDLTDRIISSAIQISKSKSVLQQQEEEEDLNIKRKRDLKKFQLKQEQVEED